MKKRILSIALAAFMLAAVLPVAAFAANSDPNATENFIIKDGVLTQYLGAGYNLHVVVPDGVREIAQDAFANHAGIVSVTLPDSVKTIHTYAFRDNTALTDVYIGSGAENITNIWAGYFYGCTALRNIHVSEKNSNFYDIDGVLFGTMEDGTKNAILCRPIGKTGGTYVVPDGTAAVGPTAFSRNSSLVSITIADSVQGGLYTSAFYGNTSLAELNIGSGIRYIDSGPFVSLHMRFPRCTALKNIHVSPKNLYLYDIDGILFSTGYTEYDNTLVYFPAGRTGAYDIPVGTDNIEYDAFYSCYIPTIIVPSTVKNITHRAFYGATVETIIIHDGITSLGASAPLATGSTMFGSGVQSIVIPASVARIGYNIFSDSNTITVYGVAGSRAETYAKENGIKFSTGSPPPVDDFVIKDGVLVRYYGPSGAVTIPNGVTEIGTAFSGRNGITSVTIPGGVTKIVDSAFYDCANLTSITIPASVKEIGNGVFYGCGKLKNISIDPANSYYKAVDGVLYGTTNGTLSSLLMFPADREGVFIIPDGVVAISVGAFSNSQITGVTIPNSVTEIGASAFYSCKLRSVVIPDSVTTIGVAAFRFSPGLWSVTLSQNLKSIGNYAFDGCSMLNSIIVPKSVTEIGEGALMKGIHIHGVAGSYAETYAKNNDSPFFPIQEAPNLDSASGWAQPAIQSAVNKGFVPSDLQGNYTNIITRQEFCRMAVKWVEYMSGTSIDNILSNMGLSRNPNAFTDTSDSDILAAYALGITNGTGHNTFSPDGQFSREQAATMLMNTWLLFININSKDEIVSNCPAAGYADMDRISGWAVSGVNLCSYYGFMSGTGNNMFTPNGTFTRQESIVVFDRLNLDML